MISEGKHMMAASKSRHRMCSDRAFDHFHSCQVSTGGRAHNQVKFICSFALFSELFQCPASLVPCSGTLSCCWPFQPLPFMPPLEAEEDVLYRVERMCSLQKANNPVRLFVFQ